MVSESWGKLVQLAQCFTRVVQHEPARGGIERKLIFRFQRRHYIDSAGRRNCEKLRSFRQWNINSEDGAFARMSINMNGAVGLGDEPPHDG